jgi:WD40 repeat protein/energy-coupling factor transporter ATP-binding protein EcfA2
MATGVLRTQTKVEVCPWKGLSPYEPADARLFVGRERAIRQLQRAIDSAALAGVVGASGSGKSSLVLAGLINNNPTAETIRPGSEPMIRLREAVSRLRAHQGGQLPLLVVDQLEEVFTQCDDEDDRLNFLDELCNLAESGTARVVVALRSDHYGTCAPYLRFAEAISGSHVLLGAPGEDELRRIVTAPAKACGLELEPGLEDEIVDDVHGEPGALPLLSHALAETWSRRTGDVLTTAGYRAAGGVRGAIARTAETAFAALPAPQQQASRAMLLRLASPGAASLDTSRRVAVAELLSPGDVQGQAALEALVSARIITLDTGAAEIAHEAVFREWPRLRGWLEDDRVDLRTLAHLRDSAHEWKSNNHDESTLYRGTRLDAALDLDRRQFPFDQATEEFVATSEQVRSESERETAKRADRQRVTNIRLRLLLSAALVTLLVAGVAGVAAVQQRNRANRERGAADARRLAAASVSVRTDQLDLAALLAVESRRLHEDADTNGALFAALNEHPGLKSYLPHLTTVVEAVIDPTGRYVADPGDEDKPLELWDVSGSAPRYVHTVPLGDRVFPYRMRYLANGSLLVGEDSGFVSIVNPLTNTTVMKSAVAHDGGVWAVAISHDGKVVVSGAEDGLVRIIDAKTGKPVHTPLELGDGTVEMTEFSPDGSILATGGDGGNVSFWDAKTWSQIGAPLKVESGAWSLAWSPDAKHFVVGTDLDIRFFDATTKSIIGAPLRDHDGIAYRVQYINSGHEVISAGEDGRVLFWDATTHQQSRPALAGHGSGVRMSINENANLVVTPSDDGKIGIWDLRGASAVAKPLPKPTSAIAALAATPIGTLVGADADGNLTLWDHAGVSIGKPVHIPNAAFTGVAISTDSSRVAVSNRDGTIRIVNPRTGVLVGPMLHAGTRTDAVALSPNGQWVATLETDGACDACIRAYDLNHPAAAPLALRPPGLKPGKRSPATTATFSPDGKTLFTGIRRGWVDAWAIPSGKHLWGTKMERGIRSLAASPNGQLVAAGANTGLLKIFEATSGKELHQLRGHRGEIGGLAFRPDSSMLASTSARDHTLRLWRMDNGLTFGRPVYVGVAGSLSPAWTDANHVAAPHSTTGAMLYTIEPAALVRDACALARRNLTQEEWRQYLPKREAYRRTCPGFATGP